MGSTEDIKAVNKRYTNICKGDQCSGQNSLPCKQFPERTVFEETKQLRWTKCGMAPGEWKHQFNKIINQK